MRRAESEFGFMHNEQGQVVGLSLGYDGCAEHQEGISGILAAFGVRLPEFPLGVGDRTTTEVPENLVFEEFKVKPRDRRRAACPGAILSLTRVPLDERPKPSKVRSSRDLGFYLDPGDKWHEARWDMVCEWDRREFEVTVRGEANVEALRDIYQAFQRKDIAVALPWAEAFFHGGMSLVIASRLSDEGKAAVLAQDTDHKELMDAAQATGIEEILKAAGRGYFALGPGWFDDQKDEVIFFLNPRDQRNYDHGWFTVQELKDWAAGKGTVLIDDRLKAFERLPENYNWSIRLLKGMNQHGIKPRYHEKFVWVDAEKTVPGLRHRATRDTEHLLASGIYPFAELMERYAEPLTATA